jgi:carboxypeptidase C (cathepsin A)
MRIARPSRRFLPFTIALFAFGCSPAAGAAPPPKGATDGQEAKKEKPVDPKLPHHFSPEEKTSAGSVTVGGQRIEYKAVAGTLVVHPKGWDDVSARLDTEPEKKDGKGEDAEKSGKLTNAEASMFYVAYFKNGAPSQTRPITFVYNGGPGSATVWLHMGAFGPKRVATPTDQHVPAAPYALVNNGESILDATDLVFIDAPGAGFSRITGPEKEKAFWGVDADAHAFAEFITTFLGKYGRWNSPKYLFGESYGTTRSAVLVSLLETERALDFNGVMLLSQVLNFSLITDFSTGDDASGVDMSYELSLPTFAATAWYHKRLGSDVPSDLKTLLAEVEKFALGDYALALQQGASLPEEARSRIAAKLHAYTGLPVELIRKANLRIQGGDFRKSLQDDKGTSTGRIDSRFAGPAMDPLDRMPGYDPFTAGIGSAYVTSFNDYVRRELGFGEDRPFRLFADVWKTWSWAHGGGSHASRPLGLNVMGDLATAMKFNPKLRVALHAGYFDLATPYFEGVYEMKHLTIPDKLQSNIEYRFYESGHMPYAHDSSRKALHDNVADFIKRTATPQPR